MLNELKNTSFENAEKLFEQINQLEIILDNYSAKVHFNSDNFFYEWNTGIGFNFTGDKVLDFLMKYYSSKHKWNYPLLFKTR